jgi:hypothetical protein
MKDLALFTWTHTEYEDVFPAYFGNVKKYFPQLENSYIAINDMSDVIPSEHTQLVNDENSDYAGRILGCLDCVEEEYIIYMQEDFILYDSIDYDELVRSFEYLKESDFSCVKLIRAGLDTLEFEEVKNIYRCFPHLSAVHQPTIWKKSDLIHIIKSLNPAVLRNFEESANASRIMLELGYKSCFYFDETSSRRGGHYDSKVFPYIATALLKAKWNVLEYPREIEQLSIDYKINLEERGCLA